MTLKYETSTSKSQIYYKNSVILSSLYISRSFNNTYNNDSKNEDIYYMNIHDRSCNIVRYLYRYND